MIESVGMSNPANKMRNKQFLKKKRSIEESHKTPSRKDEIFSRRAVAIKERATSSPSPPRMTEHRRYISTGIETDEKKVEAPT